MTAIARVEKATNKMFGSLGASTRGSAVSFGSLVSLTLDALGVIPGSIVRRRLSWAEAIDQAWFLVSVSLLPTLLIALPFGLVLVRVAPNTEVGSLANQIGAPSFVGAVDAVGTVREAAPIITAIVLAGAGGSAIAADLGAGSDHGRHPRHQ